MKRKIAMIGLGYVGLPVAVAFGKLFHVVGFDIKAQRIAELKAGYDSTREVGAQDLASADILFTDDVEKFIPPNNNPGTMMKRSFSRFPNVESNQATMDSSSIAEPNRCSTRRK